MWFLEKIWNLFASHDVYTRQQQVFQTVSACQRFWNVCFFSSSVADVALKARSLHEHKQKRHLYKDILSIGAGKSIKTTHKHKNQPNTTTRKSPSQTCVSPAEKQSKQQKPNTTKNGARAQTEHPQNRFAMRRSGLSTASLAKACQVN